MADGIDTLQEALSTLGEDARCSLEIRFDPAGAREAVEPIRMLRRDVALEHQVLDHLAAQGLPTGEYSLRIREKGRHVAQATVSLRVRQPNTAVTPAVAPPVTPAVTPAVTPGAAPTDIFREVGERLFRDAVETKLNPPEPEEYEDEDEEEEEPAAPLGSGVLSLVEKAMASPVMAPAMAELVQSFADLLKVRARTSDARARLYEARAARAGAAPSSAPPTDAPRGKVVGFRRKVAVGTGGSEGGGTHGSES